VEAIAMPYLPIVGFTLTILLVLAVALGLSYLVWSDRYKTPEAIAAEVVFFSERLSATTLVLLGCVGLVAIGITVGNSIPLP
jgi:hypothetical protein